MHSPDGALYFLSGQSDFIASFSFGASTVQMDFCVIHIFEVFCENPHLFDQKLVFMDSWQCIDYYYGITIKQLLEHINANNLDNPYQSAYKAGHSIETALLYIKNEVHLSLSRGESTALVLLDLSAAFDTIDHSTLLGCLQNWFGVSGSVLKWFTSYLMDRYQSVKIGSTLSEVCKLLFGVPQGSVLGPLLFSLYTTPPQFHYQ